jgi:hypothetical protein
VVVEVAAGRKPLPTDPALVRLLPAVDPPTAQTGLSERLVYPLSQGLPQDDQRTLAERLTQETTSAHPPVRTVTKKPPSTLTPRGSYREAKVFTVQL